MRGARGCRAEAEVCVTDATHRLHRLATASPGSGCTGAADGQTRCTAAAGSVIRQAALAASRIFPCVATRGRKKISPGVAARIPLSGPCRAKHG